MNINDLLKLDKNCLWYINANDVNIEKFHFMELGKSYREKRSFYKIEGIDDYIIKDTTMVPLIFNRTINRKLLKTLISKQEELPEIDFPIGYYKLHGMMSGTIIPYYKDATAVRKIVYIDKLEKLSDYYNHSNDKIENLIYLLIDILSLLRKMQEHGIYYIDVNTGNFVLYNNEVKVIDFDPGFISFKDYNYIRYDRVLNNYAGLVDTICRRLGFKDVLFNREDTFIDTENRVKSLKKELKGKYGI